MLTQATAGSICATLRAGASVGLFCLASLMPDSSAAQSFGISNTLMLSTVNNAAKAQAQEQHDAHIKRVHAELMQRTGPCWLKLVGHDGLINLALVTEVEVKARGLRFHFVGDSWLDASPHLNSDRLMQQVHKASAACTSSVAEDETPEN